MSNPIGFYNPNISRPAPITDAARAAAKTPAQKVHLANLERDIALNAACDAVVARRAAEIRAAYAPAVEVAPEILAEIAQDDDAFARHAEHDHPRTTAAELECDYDEAYADAYERDGWAAIGTVRELNTEAAVIDARPLPARTGAARYATREEWLTAAVDMFGPIFEDVGRTIPAVRVSVGWPGGRGKKNAVIGQCWPTAATADQTAQVFVSPVLSDAGQVLATLAHELVHAIDDCKSGHKGDFAKMARRIGLEGKLTATHAGEMLAAQIGDMAALLGVYPHGKIALGVDGADGPKKQTTRMIKVECGECGYVARTTRQWLDTVGAPLCPCNKVEMSLA